MTCSLSSLAPRALAFAFSTASTLSGASLLVATVALTAFEHASFAQATTSAAKTPYETTLAEDGVLVRASPSAESGYPFGRLMKGTKVRVVEEQVGWLRVTTFGPAFEGWFGYVQATPEVKLSDDGKTIRLSGRSQLLAPNADAAWNPVNSWKAACTLASGDELAVLDTVKSDRDTFYKVSLIDRATGWIAATAVATGTTPAPTAPTTPAPAPAPTTDPAPATEQPAAPTATEEAVDPDTGEVRVSKPEAAPSESNDANNEYANTDDATKATDANAAGEPVAKTQDEARAVAVEQVKRVKFSDVDAVWKRVAKEPVETAELEQLRDRFLALAEDAKTPRSEARAASSRAEQVAIRIDVQKSLLDIAALRQKSNAKIDGVADLTKAMMLRQPYSAVGRLNASTVYNGERLPLLYRLQEQVTGQTIAYLLPGPGYDLASMLGLLVGVKGDIRYDESLRLNTITPSGIDILNTGATGAAPAPTVTATGSETPTDGEK
jgi:hypothetical protein